MRRNWRIGEGGGAEESNIGGRVGLISWPEA